MEKVKVVGRQDMAVEVTVIEVYVHSSSRMCAWPREHVM